MPVFVFRLTITIQFTVTTKQLGVSWFPTAICHPTFPPTTLPVTNRLKEDRLPTTSSPSTTIVGNSKLTTTNCARQHQKITPRWLQWRQLIFPKGRDAGPPTNTTTTRRAFSFPRCPSSPAPTTFASGGSLSSLTFGTTNSPATARVATLQHRGACATALSTSRGTRCRTALKCTPSSVAASPA